MDWDCDRDAGCLTVRGCMPSLVLKPKSKTINPTIRYGNDDVHSWRDQRKRLTTTVLQQYAPAFLLFLQSHHPPTGRASTATWARRTIAKVIRNKPDRCKIVKSAPTLCEGRPRSFGRWNSYHQSLASTLYYYQDFLWHRWHKLLWWIQLRDMERSLLIPRHKELERRVLEFLKRHSWQRGFCRSWKQAMYFLAGFEVKRRGVDGWSRICVRHTGILKPWKPSL